MVEELSIGKIQLGHQVTCCNRHGHCVSGEEFDGLKIKKYKDVKQNGQLNIAMLGGAVIISTKSCTAFYK